MKSRPSARWKFSQARWTHYPSSPMPFPLWWFRLIPFGRRSEIEGAAYLRSLGFRIVASGYRTPEGEVDLVAWDCDQLVFVEVKARHSDAPPEDAVGFRKPVSYTHLRAHETGRNLVCRLLLEKKKT